MARACIERGAGIGERGPLELRPGEQERVARGRANERVQLPGALSAQRRLEQCPAGEHRSWIDRARIARGPDREANVTSMPARWHVDAA